MKKRHYLLLTVAILIPLAVIAASSGTTFAQSVCGLQIGSTSATTQYSGSNYGTYNQWSVQMTVPISTTCPNIGGGELWVVGNVFDTSANTNLGSANIALSPQANDYYSGQLVFTIPPYAVSHSLQLQLSAYSSYSNGQYSSLVATSTQTVTISSNSYVYSPPTTWTGYYNGSPEYCNYQNGNMYCYYSTGYYYYSSPYYYTSACYNGQAIIYYNGAYYAESCYHS